jgi:hypothetical protein
MKGLFTPGKKLFIVADKSDSCEQEVRICPNTEELHEACNDFIDCGVDAANVVILTAHVTHATVKSVVINWNGIKSEEDK